MKEFCKRWRIVAVLFLILTMVISIFAYKDNFSGNYDSLVGFIPSNFSNSITAKQQAKIDFTVAEEGLDVIYLCFTPNSEEALNTVLKFTLEDSSGNNFYSGQASGMLLYMGQYINIIPHSALPSGTKCTLKIESDVTDENQAYRILLGSSISNDITAWYSGENTEPMSAIPGLHIIYKDHFGTKTFILYCLFFIASIAAIICPHSKYYDKVCLPFSMLIMFCSSPVLVYFTEMLAMGSAIYISPKILFCNILIMIGVQLAIAAITGRIHLGTLFGVLLSALAGITSHFVMLYRGTAISPADLFAIKSAANVASHYSFAPDMAIMLSLAAFMVIIVFSIRYRAVLNLKVKRNILRRICGVVMSGVILLFSCSTASLKWCEAYVNMKEFTDSARRNGMLYNFVQSLPSLFISRPEDYSSSDVRKAAEKYIDGSIRQTDIKPDIVMVMMETWSDFSSFTDISDFSHDPMDYLHEIAEDDNPNTVVGSTVVPVYGSGTCNTEFESVTGFSMENFRGDSFPYNQYVTEGTPSLAAYLKQMGYSTLAMHPGIAETWNRKSVYPWLGFETAKFDTDFIHQDMIHELISDKACFDEILDSLPNDDSAPPMFILTVTISNHGGYNKNTDYEMLVTSDNDSPIFDEMERYSSLLYYTGNYMRDFINRLEQRERPTLVIFYGDHLPSLNSEYLDYIHFDNILEKEPLTKYTTPYMVWANYDINTSELPRTISSNYISLVALKMANLPLNGWYSFLDQMMKTAPIYNIYDVRDSQNLSCDTSSEIFQYYKWFQYAALRDRHSLPDEFFY